MYQYTFEHNLAENLVGLPQSVIKKPDGLLVSKKFFEHCLAHMMEKELSLRHISWHLRMIAYEPLTKLDL